MKTTALVFLLGFSILAAGCGPSKAEREAAERERQRLELERQAEAERRAANEALREVGKKLGRKPPAIDLGVPAEAETQTATEGHTAPETPKEP